MSIKKLKKFDDNFNSIIKSLRPIKDKFSKQSYKHDKYFKKSSLEILEKNLFGPKKSPENFYTSKLYRSIDFMYKLSNDCYDYIENLKGIKNIPIKVNKKGFNFVKNLYNPEFEERPEDRYLLNDNKPHYIYNLKKSNQNKKIFKFAVYALDPGYYNPKYDFIKKRIPSIDFSKSPNSHDNNEFAKIFQENDYNFSNNDNQEKILDNINKNTTIQEESKRMNITGNQKPELEKENEKNEQKLEIQEIPQNEENNNLIEAHSRNYQQNLDDMSQTTVPAKKEEFKLRKNFNLPRIIHKNKSQINVSTPVMISFKKMMGRDVVKKDKDLKLIEKTDIEYKPNYDFTLPHVRSFRFRSIENKQNHKKYMLGKILRSYSFNSYGYYVMDIKKKKKG